MKKLAWLLPTLLFALLPALAHAKPGRLDRTFGHAGKTVTFFGPNSESPSLQLAWGRKGRIVAAIGNNLREYAPDGRPEGSFGSNGRLSVAPPPGMELTVAGVAVDSRGRILVGGTVESGHVPAGALVARYLPNGDIDPSFGEAGRIVTDLGLPKPPPPPNEALLPTAPIEWPAVEAAGIAVDSADGPLLAGGYVTRWEDCYDFVRETPIETGYLVRLRSDGSLDTSFGTNGVMVPDSEKERFASLLTVGSGIFTVGSLVNCLRGPPTYPELARVSAGGTVDRAFGSGGHVDLSFRERPLIASDKFGRILLLGFTESSEPWRLQRLSVKGAPDRRFDRETNSVLPQAYRFSGLASDTHGRPILSSNDGPLLLVYRLRHDGKIDQSFGTGGEAITVFPADIRSTQVLVGGGGKILAGGVLELHHHSWLCLARYLGR